MITARDILLIDIDKPFDHFMLYMREFWEEHLTLMLEKFNLRALAIEYKRSTNNNTHIMIKLDKEVDYKLMLHLMLSLGCDIGLVSIGLMRLETFGDPLIKQFHRKKRNKK